MKREIPRAAGWPLVGPLPELLHDPLAFLEDAHRRHGDIYRLDLGVFRAVVLNNPRHAQHVLRDRAHNYRKGGNMWEAVRAFLGNGLVVSEGDFWLRQRRMMQPHFHRHRLAGLTELMVPAIEHSLAALHLAAVERRPVDLHAAFNNMALHVVTRALFGAALPGETLAELLESISYVTDHIMPHAALRGVPRWVPLPGRRRYQQAVDRYDRIVYDVIRALRRGGGDHPSLVTMLLGMADAETGERMTDRQVHDEVATFFLAGYDTTALALTWTIDLLIQHADVARMVADEVEAVLGGRPPTFADLSRLLYTRMVLKESLRLRPPGYWLPRTAVADDIIDDHRLPAGTTVLVVPYIYHRHPDFWPHARSFMPERFAPDQANDAARHPCAWMPFGAGPRVCLGREFALMEATLALAMFVQRFCFNSVAARPARAQLTATLRPRGGLQVRLAPRPGLGAPAIDAMP